MGWIGKVVGGALGFAVAGPVGAAIGAGIGHGADSLSDDEESSATSGGSREIPSELGIQTDDVGASFVFRIGVSVAPGAVAALELFETGGDPLRAVSGFRGDEGTAMLFTPVEENHCRFYVPFGALIYGNAGTKIAKLTLLMPSSNGSRLQELGMSLFEVQLPSSRGWNKVEYLRPLIDLCMSIVRADGKVHPDEVKTVRVFFTEEFELGQTDLNDLRRAMKEGPRGSVESNLDATFFRLPSLKPPNLLNLLAMVSKCDGEVHPKEVEIIKAVALMIGLDPAQWQNVAHELGLDGETSQGGRERDATGAYAVLGLAPGASRQEIQAAYKKLVADYHPDKVTNLPKEFQEVAHNKMAEINAAYEAVSR